MARPGTVVLVGLLLVGLLAGHAMAQPDRGPGFATQQEFERTVFEVTVFQNGSARWTFRFTRPLTNDSQRQQFEEYADRFNTEETELWTSFQDRATVLTDAGSDTTGREMTARAFEREARVNPLGNRGIVEMSFVWTGFAPADGQEVRVGDVFEDGLYIGPDQQFDVEAGPGLAFQEEGVEPAPDNITGSSIAESGSLSWDGERQFSNQHPRVVLAPDGATGNSTMETTATTEAATTADNGENATAVTPDDAGGFPVMVVSLIVLLIGLGAGAAWKSGALPPGEDDGGAAAGASASDGGAAAAGAGAAEPESPSEANPEPAVPDEELLTDEDRVRQLLEGNGGRMKQANIVEETGWSKSKVSMLLSDMEDDEEISKLRVGRENIVSLSGHEPDAAGSPFDDE